MNPLRLLGFSGVLGAAFVVLLAGIGIYVFFKRDEIGTAINPVDPNNLANRGVNAVVSDVTGRDETLGGWIYDLFHPAVADALKSNPQPPIASESVAAVDLMKGTPQQPYIKSDPNTWPHDTGITGITRTYTDPLSGFTMTVQ